MKPTVISNSSNSNNNTGSSASQQHPSNLQTPPSDSNNNTNGREFRGFAQPTMSQHSFPFDDSDDDIFGDMGLRSRLNRMGHQIPFDWFARKKRGGGGVDQTDASSNPYDQYFRDDEDFSGFPSNWNDPFGRMNSRKRNQQAPTQDTPHDRSGFFGYVPEEFRQYIPDNFGFANRQPQSPTAMPRSPPDQQRHQVYIRPEPTVPIRCDASIQTEDSILNNQPPINSLNQHGLRNTVDLGQKSPPEEMQSDRSQSAPPPGSSPSPKQFKMFTPSKFIPASGYSNSGTNTTPQINSNFQPAFNNQSQQHEQKQQLPSDQKQYPTTVPSQENVRTIPIFIEGQEIPITSKYIPTQETVLTNKPTQKQQHRPEPFVGIGNTPSDQPTPGEQSSQMPPPQTPQTPMTTDCITKIQAIQRDVLNLMEKVENFVGTRSDKEYIHLDEMLTVNLLKLDNIDTNGRERIRLARKEAIKCIQASIAVLEAKAEQKSKEEHDEQTKSIDKNSTDDNNMEVENKEQTMKSECEKSEGEEDSNQINVCAKTSNSNQSKDSQLHDGSAVNDCVEVPATTHRSEVNININGGTIDQVEPKSMTTFQEAQIKQQE